MHWYHDAVSPMGLAPGVVGDHLFVPGGLFDAIVTKTVLDEREGPTFIF